MKFLINDKQAGARIDIFLSEQMADHSRSQLQKIIKDGSITVNQQPVKPHYFLKENDEIAIALKKKIEIAKAKPAKQKTLPDIEIIADEKDFLVINKPSGLIVHGTEHISEASLSDFLIKKYPKIKKVGDDPMRPGIVHRLDKDVSGLLVVAKTDAAFEDLKSQFKKRKITKDYTALVYGQIATDDGEISFPIERSSSGYKMASLPKTIKGEKNPGGRNALTRYETLKKFINYTLLKVTIKTGRTHQIRTHLSAIDHSIVGDNLYATSKAKAKNIKLGTNRIYLVATHLAFKRLDGTNHDYTIELPSEFEEILKIIK